uniref:Uncharacterized protein n=1 Tax=Triticum urartu TaxID=4572 RepID=A0A8R7K1T6_TRIUA
MRPLGSVWGERMPELRSGVRQSRLKSRKVAVTTTTRHHVQRRSARTSIPVCATVQDSVTLLHYVHSGRSSTTGTTRLSLMQHD